MTINDNFYLLKLLAYPFCSEDHKILNNWLPDA